MGVWEEGGKVVGSVREWDGGSAGLRKQMMLDDVAAGLWHFKLTANPCYPVARIAGTVPGIIGKVQIGLEAPDRLQDCCRLL
jgi:hypothetical protein